MRLKPGLIEKIRDARRALRSEGKSDSMSIVREEKLPGISQSTLVRYFPFTSPETATMDTAVAEQACNHTGGSMPVVQEQETVTQATAAASEQTEEAEYHEQIAQLDAAIRTAEAALEQATEAVWSQAHRCAATTAIEAARGFRPRHTYPTTDLGERRWEATPAQDKAQLERLLGERVNRLEALEKARGALYHRQQAWQQAQAEKRFLATPAGQQLHAEMTDIQTALTAAQEAKQARLVEVYRRQLAEAKERLHRAVFGMRQEEAR